MADPFSVAAGVLAVVGAAGKTAQGLQKAWELRHIDEDFAELLNGVTGIAMQLQVVEISLRQIQQDDLVEELGNFRQKIEKSCSQATLVLSEIDAFVKRIVSKKRRAPSTVTPKPSKRKWLRRSSELKRLMSKVAPIVASITVAAELLRDISSSKRLDRLVSVTNLTLQNIEIAPLSDPRIPKLDEDASLEAKIETSVRKVIGNPQDPHQCSRRSSIDSFHSAVSSSSDSEDSLLSITETLAAGRCDPFCPCQCHISSQVKTPSWVKHILGTMTVHGNGSVLMKRRPCNKSCRRGGAASLSFSYLAPAWTLLKSWNLYVQAQSIHTLKFTVHTPRVIGSDAIVWSIIELGKLSYLQNMISERLTSPYDVTAAGESLLNWAASKGQDHIYKFLLQQDADPYYRDAFGVAANQPGIDRALSNMSLDRVVSFSARAASFDLYINSEALEQQEFNFWHLIVLGLRQDKLDWVLKQFLTPQSDIDAADVNGRTPLLWAAWRGDLESVELLLDSHADVNRADYEGFMLLAKAAGAGHLECVRKLLSHGASFVQADNDDLQALHHACGNPLNGLPIVIELLSKGADPNAPSTNCSPLHIAANRGSVETMEQLIESGAHIDAQDSDGDTPAAVALLCWNQPGFVYLMQADASLAFTLQTGENILHLVTWSGSTDLWDMITERSRTEQLRGVDTMAMHDKHDLHHCFKHCRERWYVGEREKTEVEVLKFQRMIGAFRVEEV